MRICSACRRHYTIFLIAAFAFFAVGIFSLSDAGLARMKISHFVRSSNLTNNNPNSSYQNRRLLDVATSERTGEACPKEDIVVSQGATTSMPNGIPTHTVQIMNVCVTGCPIAEIHLNCEWFSTARLINTKIFKHLKYNHCLVNDGKPLKAGSSISFQYADSFQYLLAVSSVKRLSL